MSCLQAVFKIIGSKTHICSSVVVKMNMEVHIFTLGLLKQFCLVNFIMNRVFLVSQSIITEKTYWLSKLYTAYTNWYKDFSQKKLSYSHCNFVGYGLF